MQTSTVNRGARPSWSLPAALLSLGLVLAACGGGDDVTEGADGPGAETENEPAASPELSDGIQALVDQAAEEGGELNLNWHLFADQPLLDAWAEEFEDLYGIPLTITNRPSPSWSENASTAIAEYEADRPASVDILQTSVNNAMRIADAGASEALDWAALDSYVAAALDASSDVVDAAGTAVAYNTSIYGVTYNLDSVDESDIPDTLREMSELPEEIALASTPEASYFQYLPHEDLWGDEFVEWYRTSFAPRLDGLIDSGDTQRLTSGEFDVLVLDAGSALAEAENERGANLGWKVLEDAPVRGYRYLVPLKHAENYATAQLFVDYLLSPGAQALLYEHGLVDLHVVGAGSTGEIVEEAEARGIDFFTINADIIDNYPELNDEVRSELQSIIEQ